MKHLFLLRGLPGSGKSTLAQLITDIVCCADDYFYDEEGNYNFDINKIAEAHSQCQQRCQQAMEQSISKIAIANTATQVWEIEPYLELAKQYGYHIYSIIVENRHNGKDQHNVPLEIIEKMRSNFEISL